eukprot:TRINITY_DN82583_c0_g1_i1.p1 TRINITY_DN82583_c0_g1~~TRINITY_DN82583_c0_g1_i1.p1  ORF type:complete len:227 (+),score=20.91 TRINITY_DN82583_c0_g1_i1:33-683(+)
MLPTDMERSTMKIRINNTPYRVYGEKLWVVKQFGEGAQLYDESAEEALSVFADGSVRLNPKHTYKLFRAVQIGEGPPAIRETEGDKKTKRQRRGDGFLHMESRDKKYIPLAPGSLGPSANFSGPPPHMLPPPYHLGGGAGGVGVGLPFPQPPPGASLPFPQFGAILDPHGDQQQYNCRNMLFFGVPDPQDSTALHPLPEGASMDNEEADCNRPHMA